MKKGIMYSTTVMINGIIYDKNNLPDFNDKRGLIPKHIEPTQAITYNMERDRDEYEENEQWRDNK